LDRHRTRPEIAIALDSGAPAHDVRFSNTLQQDYLYVAVPLLRGGQSWAVVRVSMPATAVDDALDQFERRIVVGSLIAAVVVLVASWVIVRRITRPLETITRGAKSFGRGHLEHRLPVGGSREIASLAETLNDMAAQLHARIQAAAVQQSRQEAILHSMEEGVLTLDSQGTILDLNRAAARMFALDMEKVRGRPIHEVLRKADVLRFFEDALSGELPLQEDIVIYDKDRRFLTAQGSELLDARGQRIGVLAVFRGK
jgi:two-component system phosphate regulon sensor histidine kinase PhoR